MSGKQGLIGQRPIRDCRFCGVQLTEDNWTEGNVKERQYKCRECQSIIDRQSYLRRKAKLLSSKSLKAFNRIREGYVYAISNPAWPNWIKIGMAVDADDRCASYQTSSPFRDYQIEAKQFTKDKSKLETQAHKEAEKLGLRQGEWFRINKLQAISLIKSLH